MFIPIIERSIPVIIETGYEEWPYSVRGTFFIIKVKCELFIVTAHHVINGNNINEICFRYRNNSRNCLPIDQVIRNTQYLDKNSPEYTDVILCRIDKNKLLEYSYQIELNIIKKPWNSLKKGERIWIRGYPLEKTLTEEPLYLKQQGVTFNAEYIGSYQHSGCHIIRLFPTEVFEDYNGFSGSPVFCVRNKKLYLIGVLIKVTEFQDKALFVDGSIFEKMINS